MGKLLIILGFFLIAVGLLWHYKVSIPFLGKLPGDIIIKGENSIFYFPLATCLILSIFLSVLFYLFRKF